MDPDTIAVDLVKTVAGNVGTAVDYRDPPTGIGKFTRINGTGKASPHDKNVGFGLRQDLIPDWHDRCGDSVLPGRPKMF